MQALIELEVCLQVLYGVVRKFYCTGEMVTGMCRSCQYVNATLLWSKVRGERGDLIEYSYFKVYRDIVWDIMVVGPLLFRL